MTFGVHWNPFRVHMQVERRPNVGLGAQPQEKGPWKCSELSMGPIGFVSAQNDHLGSSLDQFLVWGFPGPYMGFNLDPALISIWTLHGSESGPCMDLNLDA